MKNPKNTTPLDGFIEANQELRYLIAAAADADLAAEIRRMEDLADADKRRAEDRAAYDRKQAEDRAAYDKNRN